jgi:ribonuclease-3
LKPDHPWGREGNTDLLNRLAVQLGYEAGELGSLTIATTHKSFANEALESLAHNERFEFLGDAVLDLVVADALMQAHPDVPEGELSRYRAALVSARSLADVANSIQLGEILKLGKGEERSGGRQKPSLLADAFEAVIGAVYTDHGLEGARRFILSCLQSRIEAEDVRRDDRDFKTALQEFCQREYQRAPEYRVVNESGPDHDKEFTVDVLINGVEFAGGSGRSKKTAERAAAGRALSEIEYGRLPGLEEQS